MSRRRKAPALSSPVSCRVRQTLAGRRRSVRSDSSIWRRAEGFQTKRARRTHHGRVTGAGKLGDLGGRAEARIASGRQRTAPCAARPAADFPALPDPDIERKLLIRGCVKCHDEDPLASAPVVIATGRSIEMSATNVTVPAFQEGGMVPGKPVSGRSLHSRRYVQEPGWCGASAQAIGQFLDQPRRPFAADGCLPEQPLAVPPPSQRSPSVARLQNLRKCIVSGRCQSVRRCDAHCIRDDQLAPLRLPRTQREERGFFASGAGAERCLER